MSVSFPSYLSRIHANQHKNMTTENQALSAGDKQTTSFVEDLVSRYRLPEPVYVTRPTLPPLDQFCERLKDIWNRQWLTNNGPVHQELERALADYLGVEHISLFCNGTISLMVTLQALRINSGEVITTPFTFPATPHVLYWNRVKPVFCDIERETFNLDPDKIERLISSETKAIYPVHVYGNPCDVEKIHEIAGRHGLHVIYDASHAFGVDLDDRSLLRWGDMSSLSFHATKLFSTLEGGAIVSSSPAQKQRVDYLKNFGIAGEEDVVGPGINGKMNELQALYGLLVLGQVDEEIRKRKAIAEIYRKELSGVPGISFISDLPRVRHNYAYFPVFVDAQRYGLDRDALYSVLKMFNVNTRKYFFPLCSRYPCYSALPSSHPSQLPVAEQVAKQVLCMPIYGGLEIETVRTICTVIRALAQTSNCAE